MTRMLLFDIRNKQNKKKARGSSTYTGKGRQKEEKGKQIKPYSRKDNQDFQEEKRKMVMKRRSLSSRDVEQNSVAMAEESQDTEVPNQQSNTVVGPGGEFAAAIGSENPRRRGRGPTINAKLTKKKAKGKKLDIQFPHPYYKVCGKHAKLFKSEVTICIRHHAPFNVVSWKDISDDDIKTMWSFLKDKFNFSIDVQTYVMNQVQSQYTNRHYRLHERYLKGKDCPKDMDESAWQWLIVNKWETRQFMEQSQRNTNNRGNQEMKSIIGTKSIVQVAYEMKDEDSNEWPDAVKVWKATRQKPNGTWSTPNGEEIMTKLQEEGEKNKEKISSAAQPLVEHFSLVMERKTSYARGLGVKGVTSKSTEKNQYLAEVVAAKKRASDLEDEVARLTEMTKKQEEQIQAQNASINKQGVEMKHVTAIFAHLASAGVIPGVLLNPSSPSETSNNATTSSSPSSNEINA